MTFLSHRIPLFFSRKQRSSVENEEFSARGRVRLQVLSTKDSLIVDVFLISGHIHLIPCLGSRWNRLPKKHLEHDEK